MLTEKKLKEIEIDLQNKGLSDEVRRSIRNLKICIVDDRIEDLESLTEGLKREGFSNLTNLSRVPSINELLSENYDLIILDLNEIANEITQDDGIGVLRMLKDRNPMLPILIVTGKKINPEDSVIISRADLVRKKPILASDLADDVETIMKSYKDKFWCGLAILRELYRVDNELKAELGWLDKIKLGFYRRSLEKKLQNRDDDILRKIENIMTIIRIAGSVGNKIKTIASKGLM